MMRRICLLLSFLISAQFAAAVDEATSAHLKGIYSLYMTVDTSMASDIQSSERLDLNGSSAKSMGELRLRQVSKLMQ